MAAGADRLGERSRAAGDSAPILRLFSIKLAEKKLQCTRAGYN